MWEKEPHELVLLELDLRFESRIHLLYDPEGKNNTQRWPKQVRRFSSGQNRRHRTTRRTSNERIFWCVWLRSRSRERKRQPIRTNKGTYINTDRFEIYLLFFVCLSDFKVKTYIESRIKRSDNQLLSNVYWFSFGIIPLVVARWTRAAATTTGTSSASAIAFAVTGWGGFRTGTANRSKQMKQSINTKFRRGDDGVCLQNLLSVDSEILVDSHFVIPCSSQVKSSNYCHHHRRLKSLSTGGWEQCDLPSSDWWTGMRWARSATAAAASTTTTSSTSAISARWWTTAWTTFTATGQGRRSTNWFFTFELPSWSITTTLTATTAAVTGFLLSGSHFRRC